MMLLNTPAPEESEDCLFLNVYAPATPATSKGRAVLFWIYGGGLWISHAAHPWYDGSHFAAHEDVIVVSANYRLNNKFLQSRQKNVYLHMWLIELRSLRISKFS